MSKNKHEEHEEHMDESWLIPYADLLTLLLALFIVLFAQSTLDAKKFEELGQVLRKQFNGSDSVFNHTSPVEPVIPKSDKKPEDQIEPTSPDEQKEKEQNPPSSQDEQQQGDKTDENLEALKKKMDELIEEQGYKGQISTNLEPDGLKIVIRDVTFFSSGSADVRADKKPMIRQMSEFLALFPREVEVSGHTDDRPIHTAMFESNWDLSVKRATNFLKILLENQNLKPALFRAVGYGEFRPEVPNNSETNRATNRRVEIFIHKKDE